MAWKIVTKKDFLTAIKCYKPEAIFYKRRGIITGIEFFFFINNRVKLVYKTGHKNDDHEDIIETMKKMRIETIFVVDSY